MKLSWYYRMLLSYTPIFFVVISILIFSFFAVLSKTAEQQIVTTNQAVAAKILQAIDANLKSAERIVIKEMYTNNALKHFFADRDNKALYDYFLISQQIDEISSTLPFSNSIYLHKADSGQVLSRSGISAVEQFGDRDFLLAAYQSESPHSVWSDPRTFKEFVHESNDERVVSLVKFFPDAGEKQGVIVVNIRVQALMGFVKDLTRSDPGPIMLLASNEQPFDVNGAMPAPPNADQQNEWLHTRSEYTGWTYLSGARANERLSLVTMFNDFWMMIGLLAIVSGLVWFTYITHRGYKPIQALAVRMQLYAKRLSGELVKHSGSNELKYIEAAIDNLLERAGQYEQLHRDDLPMRQRQLTFEWLAGHKVMGEAEWKQEMAKLHMPTACARMTVAVLEIDRFADFTKAYNSRDQYLIKFVLGNVLQEITQNDGLVTWSEWTEPQRMAVIFYVQPNVELGEEQLLAVMQKMRDWTANNLEITVSAGIGAEVPFPCEAAHSFAEAGQFLSYKPVFGMGAIIGRRETETKAEGPVYVHMKLARLVAASFRLNAGAWQAHFAELCQVLQQGRYTKADIETITNYLLHQLRKETAGLIDGLSRVVEQECAPQFQAAASAAETLDEWRERLGSALASLEHTMNEMRSIKNHYSLMCSVKDYIGTHYADPNLSLNQVSEHFGLNPRYLSKLFKEEFGEKFIDYMIKVRLEEAEKLLLNTTLTVQAIAERVGYVHVISFHRAFKNMFGAPPGDYRKRGEFT
ncbi:AraC family transcriptional regulator [Paenibacillus xerothermodurans]|uniref:AraC family transcriptional regulator n=1 Tax=Paenibacillus xerothermodurans TaxID=1977292 RepID=A0A2W1NWC2_PAEXE|nr:AraC family transcriptional regulator [Paenibacillus xerothermodurans]PZE22833.1 AraC family transcriptional regulator [Paenibacillus xerothermodurans]